MQGVKTQSSPVNTGLRLSSFGSEPVADATAYQSLVGALQYATITRPNIAFSVNKVCQFMQSPLQYHPVAVKRILRYLADTLDNGLHLKRPTSMDIEEFYDAVWAANPDDRRSTIGYCIFLGGNLIGWQSKKQQTISRSSTEAEYRGLATVVTEVNWRQSFLSELKQTPATTLKDDQGDCAIGIGLFVHYKKLKDEEQS
ncbi:uncharacterized mitochondrial protein AtMg00810-like [Cannabis sativa]|uniref:uncharacterized mitochondrial protein AtMg00810-like n=1 Tax=Cannabis sativa TaxID=3483 RepID=UPI0011DFAC24|nr:uncharacterized mitochondrial protein AtMg00810-like [Cannabis sativa]